MEVNQLKPRKALNKAFAQGNPLQPIPDQINILLLLKLLYSNYDSLATQQPQYYQLSQRHSKDLG
jgi:hypothetical protein